MAEDTRSTQPFLIVGIGASAGGLDALQRFLAALPTDFGFALVFIQHLSAKHKSLLPELLGARRPSLVIQQISDGLKVQPGRLYLAPPGREIRLQNGLFETTVHAEGLIHLPIDEFLSSLAENAGDHSIAVILSGAGTDGARGCQKIRTAGGTVFVQDPQTAEFDSMPLATIATGQADAVLSPEDIAAELLKLQGNGHAAVNREAPIAPEEFEGFFRFLRERAGSRFNHYKKSVVSRRIKRRMYLHGLPTVKEYLDLVSASDSEAALLASDLMIGVTSFFRDRVAWKALNLEAVRKIVAENTGDPVRVWTPASATGEEAYSIAMMFLRELDLAGKRRDVHVFATDVNDRALERAREGRYPASITADVPHEYVQKYFTSADDGNCLVINKDVRECVVFAKQDLLTDPPFSKLDLIICRNLLIYLEPEAQEKCIKLFHYALNNNGYLFLGNAETVGRKSALFKTIGHKQCRVYRKLETKPASRLPISVPYATERRTSQAKLPQTTEQTRSVIEIIQEKLLEGQGPASVAIDQNYEIIYHNGPTNRYLRQPRGVPTQNLLELLPDTLRNRIRGALYRSGREERPVTVRTTMAGDDNKKRQVSLKIMKVRENIHVVVFQEKGVSLKEEAAETVESSAIEETAIRQLESELSATRADLQSHIEQLKSMNEEFQSSNEELQAANEELETSREELQSLNEELITVNSQLQGKIEEQDITNNDLNNFLASTNIPTIFLDTHYRVKRFTPAMLKLIKLLPSDVGRPIVDMSQENLGPDLTSDAQAVLESLMPARQELELDGAWYVRTTLPYRTADNRIEGVVVTYNDVSDLKKSEERTRHLASFPQLNPNPVCEVHSSGKVSFCNPATEKVLANLGMGMDDLTAFLPDDMDIILRELEKNEEETLYREKTIKDRVFGMTVHLAPQFNVARIYAYDITERKKAEEAQGRLAAIVESADDAIIGKDLDGIVQTWNIGAENIFGFKAKDVIGKNISLLIPPGHSDEVPEILARIRQGEHIENFETVRMRKDGTIIPVSLKFSAIKDASGKVIGASKIAHDITARKRAEVELQRKQAELIEAQRITHFGNWYWDAKTDVTTGSDELFRIYGFDPATQTMPDFAKQKGTCYPAEDWERVNAAVQRAVQTGVGYELDVRVIRDDNQVWVTTRGEVVRDAGDRIIGMRGTVQDITERKRAEEALRASEERLRLAHQVARIGSFEWDLEKQITVWSPELEALYGLQPGTIGGRYEEFASRVHPDDLPETERRIREALDTGAFEAEWRVLWPDGTIRWMAARGQVIKDDTGQPLRMIGINLDITERKRAEEAMRLSEEKFSLAFANNPAAIAMTRLEDGLFLDVNDTWLTLNGYSRDEVIGHSARKLPIWLTAEAADRFVQELREKGTLRGWEQEFLKKSGEVFVAQLSAQILTVRGEKVILSTFVEITERKRAEEALKASEEQFRALADSIPNLAWWANGDGYITWYNQRWYDYTGTTPKEMEGWGWQSVHDPELLPKVLEQWKASIATGEPFEMEFPLRGGDGRFRAFLTRGIPVKDSAGRVVRWFGTNTDITPLKRAEEALKISERRYHSLFENMIEGFAYCKMLYDDSGQAIDFMYLEVNNSFSRLTGLTDVVGKKVTEVIPGIRETDPELLRTYGRVATVCQPEWLEFYVEALKMWFSLSVYCPQKEYFIAVFDVITERKRAETEIQALAQQRQIALDAAHLGWWQYNPVTRVAEWDDGYKAIFGVSGYTRPNDEILAQIIHPDDLPGLWAKVEAALNPADPQPYRAEYRINRPDGALRWIEAHGTATFEGEGEDRRAVNLVGTVADVTERKKFEADILKLSEDMAARNVELESVNKELESFIYSISHDLRAPIRTMSGFARIMSEEYSGKLDAQGQDYLHRILRGSDKSTQLIDDLLHLSKISRQDLNRIETDLSKKASKIVEELREMNHGRSVEVVVQKGLTASVDPRLIELALSNLLGNAWKFTSKTEKARIEFGKIESQVPSLESRVPSSGPETRNTKLETVFYVKDNGAGFDMTYADKMFWPFHRLHTDKEFEGTGIGLTIVERIIHRHGGKVWAEGEPGKGATVFFTL